MNLSFRIILQAHTVKEALAMRDELRAAGVDVGMGVNGQANVLRAPAPGLASDEERQLRDAWKVEIGKNFSFKKNMRARYNSPVEALRAWKNGEMNRADIASGASDDLAPTRDTSEDDVDEVLD